MWNHDEAIDNDVVHDLELDCLSGNCIRRGKILRKDKVDRCSIFQ